MNVSACLIVKNEEKYLNQCLQSIASVVDEIIVVDTGSTDKTVQLAREFGATVFFFPWIDDFSAARNYAIEKAQGDWILMIDADEELQSIELSYWKTLITNPKYEGYFIQITSEDRNRVVRHPALRFFRRKAEYRYRGRIHEQILPQILNTNEIDQIETANIEIVHYGYSKDNVDDREKIKRNLKLLHLELKVNPKDPFMRFNLGIEYLRLGEYRIASWHLRDAEASLRPEVSYYPYLIQRLGLCLTRDGEFDSGIKVYRDGIELFPDYPDLYYYLGELYLQQGKYHLAITQYTKCLELGEAPARYVSEKGVGSFLAAYRLGNCYQLRHEVNKAIKAYTQSIQLGGMVEELSRIIADLLVQYSTPDMTKNYLEQNAFLYSDEFLYSFLLYIDRKYDVPVQEFLKEAPEFLSAEQKAYLSARNAWRRKKYPDCERYLAEVQLSESILLKYQLAWYQGDLEQCSKILSNIPADHPIPVQMIDQLLKGAGIEQEIQLTDSIIGLIPALEEILSNWLSTGFTPGIQAILNIYQKISLPDAKLTCGKIMFENGYYQEAINQFGSVEEEELDSESYYCLAKMASLGDDQITAVQLIRKAIELEPRIEYWLTYITILKKNAMSYLDKALPLFPEYSVLEELQLILNEELNEYA